MIGRTIGHYRILERLGGGGMGVVYKAEDVTLGRFVALKFLPPELTRDLEAKDRFLREARTASLLDHPNICTVYEVGEADGDQLFIAMGCYEGETLKTMLERGPLPVAEAIRIGTQILRGLGKAHAQGIVHRDIKPANVIVTVDGVAKILDFGLAKLAGAAHITRSKTTLGTLTYMAPEQLLGDPVGPPADLWAAGVVLFEAMTGQRPFRGEYAQSIAYSIINEQPASLLALRPDAPDELERVVKKLLRKDPAQRYQKAEDVLVDLDPLRNSGSGPVRSPGRKSSRPREALRAGARLGPYEIVAQVGSGGMGDVYSARDTRLDRKVAIKVLAPEFTEDVERKARFQREAKTISSLSHPNICTLFDVGEQDGVDFLVMEYLEGETLADRLMKGALPLAEVLRIGIEIGEALGKAHQQGIIHRDLKPSNVVLTNAGGVKLVDFGLAKDVGAVTSVQRHPNTPDKPLTGEGALVGTLAYMSPEQIEGREADARSDIFALGAILYEMATGRRAFEGETKASLIVAILEKEPVLLAETRGANDRSSREVRSLAVIEHVVRQCLEKDPELRWQSALDVARELRWVGERAAEFPGRGISDQARKVAGRWRGAFIALAALSVVSVAATYWMARSALQRERGVKSAASASIPLLTPITWESGIEMRSSISPDGATFVYVKGTPGKGDIFLRRVGGETAINLTKDCPENDTDPAFSPDGQSIAFRSEREGGGIFIMGATGESVRRLTDFGFSPAWSPDGREIAFTTEGSGSTTGYSPLWVVEVASGKRRKIFDGKANWPTWSPSGKRIAFDGGGFLGQPRCLMSIEASGGEAKCAVRLSSYTLPDPLWLHDGIWYTNCVGGYWQMWRAKVDETSGALLAQPERVVNSTSVTSSPSASADGRRIIFESWDMPTSRVLRYPFDSTRGRVSSQGEPVLTVQRWIGGVAPSPDGKWIATQVFPGDRRDLLLILADTGETRRITNDTLIEEAPIWAPDSRGLYFPVRTEDGFYEIWFIRVDGSGRELIAASKGEDLYCAAASPDGRWLVAVRGRRSEPVLIDLSRPITERAPAPLPPLSEGRTFQPVDWSPDGRWIAGTPLRYDASSFDQGLVVFDFEAKSYRTVAASRATGFVSWLPDSQGIVYSSQGELNIVDSVTGESRPSGSLGADAGLLALSEDGRWLYEKRQPAMERDIWILDSASEK